MNDYNEDILNNVANAVNNYFLRKLASKVAKQYDQHMHVVKLFNKIKKKFK